MKIIQSAPQATPDITPNILPSGQQQPVVSMAEPSVRTQLPEHPASKQPASKQSALVCPGTAQVAPSIAAPEPGYLAAAANRIASLLGFRSAPQPCPYQGRTALVTGASSGIGSAFAEKLAQRGANLVLTARSEDKLQALAERLRQTYGVQAEVIVLDLSTTEGPSQLVSALKASNKTVDVLVNNAGIGIYKRFEESTHQDLTSILNLHVNAAVFLTHAFLGDMQQRGHGTVVNVSSIGAKIPMPYMATTCATKAFLHHFTECLWAENQGNGLRILSLCPASTDTPLAEKAHIDLTRLGGGLDSPEHVVETAMNALARGDSFVVPNLGMDVQSRIMGILPRGFVLRTAESMFRKIDLRSR